MRGIQGNGPADLSPGVPIRDSLRKEKKVSFLAIKVQTIKLVFDKKGPCGYRGSIEELLGWAILIILYSGMFVRNRVSPYLVGYVRTYSGILEHRLPVIRTDSESDTINRE